MTPYNKVFSAFLAKVKEDDWAGEVDLDIILADWESILESALPYFKFPRTSLARAAMTSDAEGIVTEGHFVNDLGDQEVQIIATLMKQEWLDRTINTWENVKVMYDERDFSQANLLNQFIKLLEREEKKAIRLQKIYSRSIQDEDGNRKSYKFSNLAGGDK